MTFAKAPAKPTHSLTSDFRKLATPEQKAVRKARRTATIARNKQNQAALGNWHNSSRGQRSEIPFPVRGK